MTDTSLFLSVDPSDDALELRYIPLAQAALWDMNPKEHDIGAMAASFEQNGRRDPPAYDAALGALVEGNGRTEALLRMYKQGASPPRGVIEHPEFGWCIPVLFGLDADSQAAATRYALDHNNLPMAGGDGLTDYHMAKMYDRDKYERILQDLARQGQMPVTVETGFLDDLAHLAERSQQAVVKSSLARSVPADLAASVNDGGDTERGTVGTRESKTYRVTVELSFEQNIIVRRALSEAEKGGWEPGAWLTEACALYLRGEWGHEG